MTAISTYSTGTVSVANGDTVIVGAGGANWSGTNAKPGDDIVIAGQMVPVLDVVDSTHLTILPWPFSDVPAGTDYDIIKRSVQRTSGGTAALQVSDLVGALNTDGFYVFVAPDLTAPDPSLGEENQFALQISTGKLWLKTGGVWVFQGIYKGFQILGPWDSGTDYAIGDVVSLAGSSYVALAPSTNQTPPNVTYWQVLAAAGTAATISVGTTTTGAPGTDAEVTNSGTPTAAVLDFTIPAGKGYGGTSTTSLAIGTGTKAFTTQANLAYQDGARVRATATAGATGWLEGIATYSGTTLTISADKINGSGTHADWNFNVVGEPGAGDLSSANNLSDVASAATARANLGINQAIQCAASQNLNSLTDPGTYFTVDTSSTNGPGVADYWMVEVQSMTAFVAGDIGQRILGLTTGATYTRTCVTGSWGAWKLVGGSVTLTNVLGTDVNLNNMANYFDGPSVAQGTSGTWLATGTVLCEGAPATDEFHARLTDGTTVAAAGDLSLGNGIARGSIHLSGIFTNPAGNIRIQVRDTSSTGGVIRANNTGNAKDNVITVVRLQ